MQFYWPEHQSSRVGWVVGWHNQPSAFVIAAVLPDTLSVSTVCSLLVKCNQSADASAWRSPLILLGKHFDDTTAASSASAKPARKISQHSVFANAWLLFTQKSRDGQLFNLPSRVVEASIPSTNEASSCEYSGIKQLTQEGARDIVESSLLIKFKPTKSSIHFRFELVSPSPDALPSLPAIQEQINASYVVERRLQALVQSPDASLQSAPNLLWNSTHSAPLMYTLTWALLMLLRIFEGPLRAVLWVLALSFRSLSIPTVSMVAHQIEERGKRLLNAQKLWKQLHQPSYRTNNQPEAHEMWINVFNTCSAIIVDWLLGLAMLWVWWNYMDSPNSAKVIGYDIRVTDSNSFATTMWGYEKLRSLIEWLQAGRPGGIKLNLPTSDVLATVFLFYIERWAVIIRFLSTVLRNVLYAVPFSGALGLSFLLSTLHDFMFFVNMHIFWLYTAMARLYNVQLRLLSWLWLIFRGKRRNEEKKRIESCEYSVDQLVLSTMAFAVVVFLLPTVGIYYLLFLFAMMFVLVFRTFFKLVNAMINSAPWYGLWCFLCQRAKAISVGVKVEPLPPLPNVPSVTLISLSPQSPSLGLVMSDFATSVSNVLLKYPLGKIVTDMAAGNRLHSIGLKQPTPTTKKAA